jgi:hypothetical protein
VLESTTSGSRLRALAALALFAVLSGACSRVPAERLSPTPAPIRVEWQDPNLSTTVDGWTIRRCEARVVALCVDRDDAAVGHVLMEDLPSIGEERTSSQDQVQATLAVRTQTLYQLFRSNRTAACGSDYTVDTATPKPVPVAGLTGLRYEGGGRVEGRVVERTIGFRVFRDGIETLLEATAVDPGHCLTAEEPTFSVRELRSFEPVLNRIVAGSVLPPATEFPDLPAQPGGSRDPRMSVTATNGIGISHGLGSSS